MEDDPAVIDQEIDEIEFEDLTGGPQLATPEEAAAMNRSLADERSFDQAVGRLIRAMTVLEGALDGLLIELVAVPRSAEFFWDTYLAHRGLSSKADDLRALLRHMNLVELEDRASRVAAHMKRVAKRRNELVHKEVGVGPLPSPGSATQFHLFPRQGTRPRESLTATELDQLVGETETVYLRLVSLEQAISRREAENTGHGSG